ncbi:PREDICTED: NXPE family member 3-like isoform X3 [Cyprinodon variegatus]|nr:PREDICTED: NXPE family member 3-like isoform X3 [Cyprinodon variegatus]
MLTTNSKSEIQPLQPNRGQCFRSRCLMKYGFIFLLLTLCVLCFTLYNLDVNNQRSRVSAMIMKKFNTTLASKPTVETLKTTMVASNMMPTPTDEALMHPDEPTKSTGVCSYHSVSPEDALELKMLKESITWPTTPSLLSNLSLNDTSDPAHSTFTILPRKGGGSWHLGDQLEVLINIHDFQDYPKKFGGDVLLARLHNPALSAGVVGTVLDHHNGSYTAVFSLLWEGSAQVEVTLDHPSEAVTVLEKLTQEQPDRIYFKSTFRSGSTTETVSCNVCLEAPKQKLCNYTDIYTGEPWFCYKPKKLSCANRITHSKGGFKKKIEPSEELLFQKGINMKVFVPPSGPASINILPSLKGQTNEIMKTKPAGYYYKGVWRALDGTTVNQFNNGTAISSCLKGKMVHLYGDSTIRQWFEYLITRTPDLKKFDLKSPQQTGPFLALDYKNKIMVTFRCHGPPIRFTNLMISQTRFIANELKGMVGGTNTVIVIGIWSHFSTFPVEVYIRRLLNIRRAVVQLLTRAPGTLVIIRTANPKTPNLYETLTNSDWYSLQRDKILRAVFKGVNVRMVDAWEMTVAHSLPHSLHPQLPIIKNMIDVVLSYICPTAGKQKKKV